MTLLVLKTNYKPTFDEACKLREMQAWLNEASIGMLVDCKYDKYQYTIRRQQLASRLRGKWQVIQGENSCESPPYIKKVNGD